jgi:co-chaperonin GroES (HSP10)
MYEATGIDEDILAKLPEPAGYRLLIATLKVSEKTEGGVYMPDKIKDAEADGIHFGVWCSKWVPRLTATRIGSRPARTARLGDFVIFRSYSGTRFKIEEPRISVD